jgi:hypothetical protein
MGFNVVKGWPLGSGLEDSAIPYPGVTIEAGMFLKKVAHPTLAGVSAVRPVDVDGGSDSIEDTFQCLFALDSSSAFDVIESNRLPYLVANALVETDMVAAVGFSGSTIGDPVFLSSQADEAGLVTSAGALATDICVGLFDGVTTLEDVNGDETGAIRIILMNLRA